MFYTIECKYDDVAFSDCDPIKLTKWRQNHLIAGGALCEKIKNETKSCDTADFPPGMCLFILLPCCMHFYIKKQFYMPEISKFFIIQYRYSMASQ